MGNGLWSQLEKGKNKFTVTTEDLREVFEEFAKMQTKVEKRQFVVRTGQAGAQAINDSITEYANAEMHKIEVKRLILILDQLLMAGRFGMSRHKTLTHLIMSEDMENFNMAKIIIESYG